MRENWAKFIVVFTGLLVVLLAYMFADSQNPVDRTASSKAESLVQDLARVETGRKIFNQQMCLRCHSIGGEGNPRYPLDGVGKKLTASELGDWITGSDKLQGKLSESIIQMKQDYRKLSADELNALVIYLQSQ